MNVLLIGEPGLAETPPSRLFQNALVGPVVGVLVLWFFSLAVLLRHGWQDPALLLPTIFVVLVPVVVLPMLLMGLVHEDLQAGVDRS